MIWEIRGEVRGYTVRETGASMGNGELMDEHGYRPSRLPGKRSPWIQTGGTTACWLRRKDTTILLTDLLN